MGRLIRAKSGVHAFQDCLFAHPGAQKGPAEVVLGKVCEVRAFVGAQDVGEGVGWNVEGVCRFDVDSDSARFPCWENCNSRVGA